MNKLLAFLMLLSCTRLQAQVPGCTYVAQHEGIDVFNALDMKFQAIAHLDYGTLVKVVNMGRTDSVEHNGNKVLATWVQIQFSALNRCLDDANTDVKTGFTMDIYLSAHLKKIPLRSLYYIRALEFGKDEFRRLVYTDNPSECYSKKTSRKQGVFTPDCYPYYSPNLRSAEFSINAPDVDTSLGWADTIKHYIKLELIDSSTFIRLKKKKHPYTVDTSMIVHYHEIDESRRSFHLPIRNAKDSILFQDAEGNDEPHHMYKGKIKGLNSYLIDIAFEGPSHYLVDMNYGKKEKFTEGFPYISPDRNYVIDYYRTDYFANPGTHLTLSKLDKNLKLQRVISVDFKSWVAISEPNDAFWISNRELIIKVTAVDNVLFPPLEKPNIQYIKLTIL